MKFVKSDPDPYVFEVPGAERFAVFEANALGLMFCDTRKEAESAASIIRTGKIMKPVAPMRREFSDDYPAVCFQNTFACNLACKYCFVNDDPGKGQMEFKTAKGFLDKHCNPAKVGKSFSVSFMGGEPLLNMDLICRVVAYVKKRYASHNFSLTTNGIALKDKLADAIDFDYPDVNMSIGRWLKRNGFHLTLSLDGPERAQNEHRIRHDGTGSFADVMSSIDSLKADAPDMLRKLTFRATYSPGTAVSIVDRLVFFNDLISAGVGGNIHIELAPMAESGCLSPCGEKMDMDHVRNEYYEGADWVISEAMQGRTPRWSEIIRKTMALILGKNPRLTSCGAGYNYVTCGADGEIYACHRTCGAKIGSLTGGIDNELSSKWADNRVYSRSGCMACHLRYVCGGACRAVSVSLGGDTATPSAFECEVKKIRFKTALKIIAALPQSDLDRICPPRKPGPRRGSPGIVK